MHSFFAMKLKKVPNYLRNLKPNLLTRADHDYHDVFIKSKKDIEKIMSVPLHKAYILVIGCGYRYPDVLLYSNYSNNVYGLDIEKCFYRDGFFCLYQYFRKLGKGYFASLYNTLRNRNGVRKYNKRISSHLKKRIKHSNLNLISYGGKKIPFENNYFDIVLSHAVLQEVIDLDAFFFEIKRVTKPNGISYHVYHNYYSLTGGYIEYSLCEKEPWGHLRGFHSKDPQFLNRITITRLKEIFSNYFELLNVFQLDKNLNKKGIDGLFCFDGNELLTPNIKKELKQYSFEQLLTTNYLIIGRKS